MTHKITDYPQYPAGAYGAEKEEALASGKLMSSEFTGNCSSPLGGGYYVIANIDNQRVAQSMWIETRSGGGKDYYGVIVRLSKEDSLALANWIIEKFN